MTDTYSGDPSSSPKDAVRFLLSDVASPWNFSDEEVNYAISQKGNPFSSAAQLADVMAARMASKRDKTVGPLSTSYSKASEQWSRVAKELRQQASKSSGALAIMTQNNSEYHYFRLGQMDFVVPIAPDIINDLAYQDPTI